MMWKSRSFEELVTAVKTVEPKARTKLVAIDGRGGSGKSTLTRALEERIDGCRVMSVDDFWLAGSVRPERAKVVADPGCDYDWARVHEQVIEPLLEDRDARYQRYDWATDSLVEWVDVPVGGTVILDGVFTLRGDRAALYDFRVWVEADEATCLARGIERDGGEHTELWNEEWMPAYRTYIEAEDPMARADCVLKI